MEKKLSVKKRRELKLTEFYNKLIEAGTERYAAVTATAEKFQVTKVTVYNTLKRQTNGFPGTN